MVFFALLVGAELDGLTNLQPSGGCDDRSFPYYFKVRFPYSALSLPFLCISPIRMILMEIVYLYRADRSCGARTAGKRAPRPPASPSTRSSNCPAAKAPPTSSRRYHLVS